MDERLAPYGNRPEKVPTSILAALASAVLEWFLIFLLFISGSFSYLVTKFARYCHLQSPCLLCSRVDHILGNEKTGFYWELICQKHKAKISSLVLCHLHSNLVDVHGMCESCLFSFATINKSNTETYRLLVGKLGAEALLGFDRDPLLDSHVNGSSGSKTCSCCNEKWISRGYSTELFQAKSIVSKGVDEDDLKMVRDDTYRASRGVELDVPFSKRAGHDDNGLEMVRDDTYQASKGFKLDSPLSVAVEHDGDDLKMIRDETDDGVKGAELDAPLPVAIGHVEDVLEMIRDETYVASREVELDAPLSVNVGDDIQMIREDPCQVDKGVESESPLSATLGDDGHDLKMDRDETYRAGKVSPSSISNFDPLPHVEYKKVQINSDSESEALISDNESVGSLSHEGYTKKDFASRSMIPEPQIITFADDPVLEKLIQPASVPEPSPEVKLEDNDIPCSSSAAAPVGHGLEEIKWQQFEHKTDVSALPELISFDEVIPVSRDIEGPIAVSGETLDAIREADKEVEEVKELGDSKVAKESFSTSEVQLHPTPNTSEPSSQLPNSLELGDAYKLALGSRGRQLSGKLLDQMSLKESTRASEDFKLLLSQISSSRGVEISFADMSPRVSGNIDDGSTSVGIKILQKRVSLERNESGLSLDGSTVSEIEGESAVDRLKRQVEHDKRLMSALYQELEDERNASAVAVNQAMAMITRLQEEKAALQMEALQCLRMMEDQAEYDAEDLQIANNLVAEKENEIQDLRAKLELYMTRFGPVSISDDTVEPLCEPVVGATGKADIDTSLEKSNDI